MILLPYFTTLSSRMRVFIWGIKIRYAFLIEATDTNEIDATASMSRDVLVGVSVDERGTTLLDTIINAAAAIVSGGIPSNNSALLASSHTSIVMVVVIASTLNIEAMRETKADGRTLACTPSKHVFDITPYNRNIFFLSIPEVRDISRTVLGKFSARHAAYRAAATRLFLDRLLVLMLQVGSCCFSGSKAVL
jgi:hypothetical protein